MDTPMPAAGAHRLAAASLIAFLLTAAACGKGEREAFVQLSKTEPAAKGGAVSAAGAIRIAVSAVAAPRQKLQDYERIIWYVGKKLGRPVELVLRPTYEESTGLLARREVDVVFMCAGPYVEARRRFGAEALAVPMIQGATTHRSYIIVHRDSPYRGFEDLRGKAFAFVDPHSHTGRLYPAYLAARSGAPPEAFFAKSMFTRTHDSSIEAVAEGRADGAAVESLIWEQLRSANWSPALRTRVIVKSPPFGTPPLVAHPLLAQGLKQELRRAFLEMNADEEGRALLSRIGIERYVEADDSMYDGIRRIHAAMGETN